MVLGRRHRHSVALCTGIDRRRARDAQESDPGELHAARLRIAHLEHEVDVLTEALALLARRSRPER